MSNKLIQSFLIIVFLGATTALRAEDKNTKFETKTPPIPEMEAPGDRCDGQTIYQDGWRYVPPAMPGEPARFEPVGDPTSCLCTYYHGYGPSRNIEWVPKFQLSRPYDENMGCQEVCCGSPDIIYLDDKIRD